MVSPTTRAYGRNLFSKDLLVLWPTSAALKLYGLTEEELRYILDPKHVYGEDFPSETFRVLKEKETRLYGEYRTKRLVLEAWGRLQHTNAELPHNDSDKEVPFAQRSKDA